MVVAGLGEILYRISPINNAVFLNEDQTKIYVGGAAYNVLTYLSQFGHTAKFFSAVPNNKLGAKVLHKAQAYKIDTSSIIQSGNKIGMYFALDVNEVKPQEVLYDRKYSSFYEYDFTLAEIKPFLKDVDILHLSGITPALSKKHQNFVLEVLQYAQKNNIKISYDSNFRSKLWSQQEAGEFLKLCLPYINYGFLGILDLKYLLNYHVETLIQGYTKLCQDYPNLEFLASTNREVISPTKHTLQANVFTKQELYTSPKVKLNVIDRIGGGDAYTAGILHGIINNDSLENIGQFALSNAVLKHYVDGDNYFVQLQEVINYQQGSSQLINR